MTDNIANVRNYQIQLQQVETALASDPDNEELKKLQEDLQEVLQLTMAIMTKEELAALENSNSDSVSHNFKAGDYVLAPWSEDGQFYEAQIEDITSDGQCTVVFSHQKKRLSEVCLVELLKPLSGKNRRPYSSSSSSGSHSKNDSAGNSLKHFKQAQEAREALKKKQQKRKEKLKQLEEEREKDKMKWQSFSSKVMNKKMKGTMKKSSIFATPESVTGRVGVGTCGVGGKPMTEYQMKMEKVKKTVTTLPKFSLSSDDEIGRSQHSSRDGPSIGRNRF